MSRSSIFVNTVQMYMYSELWVEGVVFQCLMMFVLMWVYSMYFKERKLKRCSHQGIHMHANMEFVFNCANIIFIGIVQSTLYQCIDKKEMMKSVDYTWFI